MDEPPRDRLLALNYAAAIFISAFLLFQVQPLVSKHILPWFGGSAAVWTTCLLFFQTVLFFGYAYADFIHARLEIRTQVAVHMGLIVAAIVFGRVLAGPNWEPRGGEEPLSSILTILALSVGLPYFVLSATGPLLQAWFARSFPGRSPYRLYALSNVGSLLALLSYPFYFERRYSMPRQAAFWLAGFLLYGALCAYAAWRLWRSSRVSPRRGSKPTRANPKQNPATSQAPNNESDSRSDSTTPPKPLQRALWILWPMFASIVLMATTNHVSTDIAAVPFLWIAPLALYLLTFIIAFDRPGWYFRTPLSVLVLASIYLTALVHSQGVGSAELFNAGTPGWLISNVVSAFRPALDSPTLYVGTMAFLAVNFATMFFICMQCHGELFRLRPDPKFLTSYYLMIALGGALGGVFVTFIAPQLFATYYEWELSLFIACILAIGFLLRGLVEIIFHDDDERSHRPWHYAALGALVLAVFLPSAIMLLDLVDFLQPAGADAKFRFRNFYGTLAVFEREEDDPKSKNRLVKHGTITHGIQFTHQDRRNEPVSYYGSESGVARTIDFYRRTLGNAPLRLGVVGLGAGTMAAYAQRGDSVTFYEIDADVVQLTESCRWFTFLNDCRQRGAHCDVRLGDARLTLQRELQAQQPQKYHVIVLDAFSGDSVPAHLLTLEAFELYLAHLNPGEAASATDQQGAILVHISNRYLNLAPLVFAIAEHLGLGAVHIGSEDDAENKIYRADWIVVSHNRELIEDLAQYATSADRDPPIIWTDDHSSLFDLLK